VKCVAIASLFKSFCTSCHYNFEDDRCSFCFKLEFDSLSSRKRIRDSETESSSLSIIKRQINRRDFVLSLSSSSFSKARKSRSIVNQKLAYDRDLLTNSERLRRISSLFTKLEKLFSSHARAVEKKLKRKEDDK
jgi:hypothetical protein